MRSNSLTVGIVGLGLIGGSIAYALKRSPRVARVVGINRSDRAVSAAVAAGVIAPDLPNDLRALRDCDVIFICTSVDSTIDQARAAAAAAPAALITDVASTKAAIVAAATRPVDGAAALPRFIGGHPMAGSQRRGFDAASALIMENAIYVLTPDDAAAAPPAAPPADVAGALAAPPATPVTPSAPPTATASPTPAADLAILQALISDMGALPLIMPPDQHDRAVAAISHLPHLAASALCAMAAQRESDGETQLKVLAAGGFRDLTRVASSSPDLWTEIASSSAPALLPALDDYLAQLHLVRRALQHHQPDELRRFFATASAYRAAIAPGGKGLLQGLPQIRVDVADRPGEIGTVATLLGEVGINIQNIQIQNNREFEGGLMRITLQNAADVTRACHLLESSGRPVRDGAAL